MYKHAYTSIVIEDQVACLLAVRQSLICTLTHAHTFLASHTHTLNHSHTCTLMHTYAHSFTWILTCTLTLWHELNEKAISNYEAYKLVRNINCLNVSPISNLSLSYLR